MAVYQAMQYLSSGTCKTLLTQSPLHAWTESPLNPLRVEEEKTDFDSGSAAHDYLLEGGAGIQVIDPENYRSKPTKASPDGNVPKGWTNDAIREARDNARAAGKSPVLPRNMADIKQMAEIARDAIRRCKDLSGLTQDACTPEATVIWQEGEMLLKARPDLLATDFAVVLDYKTTTNAAPAAFSRQIATMGYHYQASFYQRAVASLTGGKEPAFVFLAQENVAPFRCTFHGIAPSLKQIADMEIARAIRTWGACLKSGKWPAYPLDIHWCEATSWQMESAEEGENRMLSAEDLAAGIPG